MSDLHELLNDKEKFFEEYRGQKELGLISRRLFQLKDRSI